MPEAKKTAINFYVRATQDQIDEVDILREGMGIANNSDFVRLMINQTAGKKIFPDEGSFR